MVKYTPGPWEYVPPKGRGIHASGNVVRSKDHPGKVIADPYGQSAGRLIVELLNALIEARGALHQFTTHGPGVARAHLRAMKAEARAWELAGHDVLPDRAVIAKAEGKS